MTLATCEAIKRGGRVDPADVADRFVAWFRDGKIHGVGASTLHALRDLDAGAHWASAGRAGDQAAGNGAAMRVAPLAFCPHSSAAMGRTLLRDICSITHRNDEAYAGALAIVSAVTCALSTDWDMATGLAGSVAASLPDTRVRDALRIAADIPIEASVRIAAGVLGCSGYVVESVPLAIFAAQRATVVGFEAVIAEVCDTHGDTDTVASMAGQIVGAHVGLPAIPAKLRECVDDLDAVRDIAARLADRIYGPAWPEPGSTVPSS